MRVLVGCEHPECVENEGEKLDRDDEGTVASDMVANGLADRSEAPDPR